MTEGAGTDYSPTDWVVMHLTLALHVSRRLTTFQDAIGGGAILLFCSCTILDDVA